VFPPVRHIARSIPTEFWQIFVGEETNFYCLVTNLCWTFDYCAVAGKTFVVVLSNTWIESSASVSFLNGNANFKFVILIQHLKSLQARKQMNFSMSF